MGRLIRSSEFDGANNLIQRIEQLYDKANRLEKQSCVIGGKAYSESYTYDTTDGMLASAQTATGDKILYYYDGLKRLNETGVKDSAGNTIYRTGYIYKAGTETNQTTSMIRGFTVWNPDYTNIVSTRYEYDALGNITRIEDGTGAARTLAEYTYDELNQLTQEKIYNYNGTSATPASTDTYVYTYDSAGNILTEKKNGAVVNAYTYSTGPWADQLVAVNGEEITYDGSGNPEMYYSANGIDYDFCWTEGRQLAWLQGWGEVPFRANYEYDADGIRVAKSTETITGIYSDHAYVTQNGKVMRETIGTGATAKVLDFIYDNSGKPFALIYTNGTATPVTCYYVLNIQGDVIALMTADRTIVARYTYNAWGKILSVTDEDGNAITSASHIANLNPIRYRGYYYDTETGFYYLQSRYYDPANHRFINADAYYSTGQGFIGTNTYAYCLNNPANNHDASGKTSEEDADEIIEENAVAIKEAAEEYGVDPVAIAACIYTEQVLNYSWLDDFTDYLLYMFNTSIGIGQVRVSTAKMLEDSGYIEKTEATSFGLYYVTREQLIAAKLLDENTNIRYVAAYLRYWQDQWDDVMDISDRMEILTTLYNLGENANGPNRSPKPNNFGVYADAKYGHLYGLLYQ